MLICLSIDNLFILRWSETSEEYPQKENHMSRIRRRCLARLLALSCILFLGALESTGYTETSFLPPNGELKVAYRQFQEGELGKSVHHLTLFCIDGDCSLTTLTLNQCMPGLDNIMSFYPKIQRTTVAEGNTSVIVFRNEVVVKEKIDGTEFTYNFKYTVKKRPKLSKDFGLRQEKWFDELTGFSGAAVKYSTILNKVITWEFVPLKGRSPIIEAECKIMLDGVP